MITERSFCCRLDLAKVRNTRIQIPIPQSSGKPSGYLRTACPIRNIPGAQFCSRSETLGFDQEKLTAIRHAPWHPHLADKLRANRGTSDSTGHSGSHASSAHRDQYPRVGPIELRDPSELRFRGNHVVLGWETWPALPSGNHAAGVPIAVRGSRPSCSPVIMAYAASLDARGSSDIFQEHSA